jgi:hypothetical protein
VLSNGAEAGNGYARVIAVACAAAGIAVDVVGGAAGNSTSAPEGLLTSYDLVFAKARSALEALAVGCATVLTDVVGAGRLVTPQNYDALRRRNFGIRELTRAHDAGWYAEQIAHYRPAASAEVSARVRAEAGLEPAVDRLLDVYAAAMAAPPGCGDPSRAAAIHCCRIATPLKQAYATAVRAQTLAGSLELARSEISAQCRSLQVRQTDVEGLRVELGALREQVRERDRELMSTRDRVGALRREIAEFQALPTLRLRDAVLKAPVVGSALQAGARRLAKLLKH